MHSSTAQASASQTLARGLEALDIIAANPKLTIAELSQALGVHRSSAYRILRTLEEYGFARRDQLGTISLGKKLTSLAHHVTASLRSAATPAITTLAHELGMTAFLALLDGDAVVTLVSVEPNNVAATVSRNPGVRHSIQRGAPGHALEALLTPSERHTLLGDAAHSAAAREVQQRGYSISHGEVIPGITGIAIPLTLRDEPPAALALVHFTPPEHITTVLDALHRTAIEIVTRHST